ncbi:helix-turn-helix domain-containing protein [Ectobacillus antri]|uniref:helix-turn-helix domain-containing protein n=1 Tax=Ectobacillus antri TaxID=2486280 RepID=UPI001FE7BE95|nr:helix-turn-helix transcriptional regulator [Ectobacillus antri]
MSMEITAKRLQQLRERKGWSKTFVAKKIGLKNMATYANYEYGKRQPDHEILVKIAELYEVSIDYLLGRSDNEKLTEEQQLQIDDRTRKVIETYMKLTEEHQFVMEEMINNLYKIQK